VLAFANGRRVPDLYVWLSAEILAGIRAKIPLC
jgi:hypothetical protein